MTRLVECPGCTRHVRADDGRCPFCGRAATTAAPNRMLVLALPLTLMACTSENPSPASKPEASKPSPTQPVKKPSDPVPAPDDPVLAPNDKPLDGPADGGVVADPVPTTDDRIMATKYGGPPVMTDPGPKPIDVAEPKPEEEIRPAKKYGAPPRPAPKYGGAPKPGAGNPLGD